MAAGFFFKVHMKKNRPEERGGFFMDVLKWD